MLNKFYILYRCVAKNFILYVNSPVHLYIVRVYHKKWTRLFWQTVKFPCMIQSRISNIVLVHIIYNANYSYNAGICDVTNLYMWNVGFPKRKLSIHYQVRNYLFVETLIKVHCYSTHAWLLESSIKANMFAFQWRAWNLSRNL